ncbi:PREDICTED: zinc finger protein 438 [Condylura cristata]|uniref:zinc finger protein 438 n=1 Tax=Condylura cristata TaxID=143302 RepID=UPI000642A2A1|nr:PREDICTED: zinc finger protein 438 [Condylura cristata]XP_012586882.1 PREDICTED: zinc finger protein 438 [Condylura cristata]
MQNSLSVPSKDQGDVPVLTSPVEKHLNQKMLESPGKTFCTGEPNTPSGTNLSGKGLQSKSHFRTIAPKIMPKVPTPRVLSCHSPSFCDQGNPGPSINSTSLGMPTQNYALMQVAGQEGTFSLVALPHVASAQPFKKPIMPLPENLKLPIPRYQRPQHNKGSRKKPILNSPESGCSKPPSQTQISPFPPDHPEPPHKPGQSERLPSLNHTPASVGTTVLTDRGGHGHSLPPLTQGRRVLNSSASPTLSIPGEPSAKQGFTKLSGKANSASKKISNKPSSVANENCKECTDLGKVVTNLSPAVLGGGIQLIPKGKLPILPCPKVKTKEVCKSESDVNIADFSLSGLQADCDKTSSITEATTVAGKIAVSKQSPCESPFCPVTKLDLSHKTKLSRGTAKRRGRKRKIPDEILAFQGKRRKYIINKGRENDRLKNNLQESRDPKPGAVKKYRSIMPKPVLVMPTLASPVPTLQFQTPESIGQGLLLSSLFTPKNLDCKQDGSPSPKSTCAFRNGFSGVKKPWHRCHFCNHVFQFKQHLRDHMNTHTNRRPYSCRICRKAYVHSGSLSTHMKLHHSESRLKKLICCEFCAKVFGHVRVYFGHLKEVHRVIISTEPSPSELHVGDMPRTRDLNTRGMEGSMERENKSCLEEDLLLNQAGEVKLQIKCGRCQITAQSFAEIKFHLLYVHGEESQGRLQERLLPGSRGAPEDLASQTAAPWKQCPERIKQEKQCPSDEELHTLPKSKGHLHLHHQNDMETLMKDDGAPAEPSEPRKDPQAPECPSPHTGAPQSQSGFHCILCARTLRKKEELLVHWEQRHKCEDPPRLWTILNALSAQRVVELASGFEK